ncbi:MAG TPA: peptide deformylase [Bosea sp. (in: a-proteobacteria)]|jgi:peptide deformylase|uniref:peptide deformylase n=1 Tax=Bosea sp. (in: a-proteobacteria) TaxID=1871050 RepID=UPI002E0DC2FB|nr:peptide deformylase [Bosea sp. (in: a-proteobacteria)]
MSIRPILRFPDPCLKLPAAPVVDFDESVRELATDLLDTMRAAPGVGITAPHVGVMKRLVVLELTPGEVRTYVNPVLLWSSPETQRATEGSVSMPGVTEEIERAARVRIGYRDLDGNERVEEADGFRAVCHQHEIDQLDGIFWIERLSRLKRDRVKARYDKLRRA